VTGRPPALCRAPGLLVRAAAIASLLVVGVALASDQAGALSHGRAALDSGGTTTAPTSTPAGPPPLVDGHGLRVDSVSQINARLVAVTVSTAALPKPAHVRILLPAGYSSHPDQRYPVLYLFNGTNGTAADWTTYGDAEQTTAGLPLIVVMPSVGLDGDGGGWCTNWVNTSTSFGPAQWERYDIDQLVPWVDQNFRTIAGRDGRAIAGLSQGGFCAMSLAAQFPDLFVAASSYSGAPDIAYDLEAELGAAAIINFTEVFYDGVPPDSMFGNPLVDQVNWANHDPTTLAGNLLGMALYLYDGDGLPGPYDTSDPVDPEGSGIEAATYGDTLLFHDRLDALGIPSYWDAYGPGTHTWPYWARDLRQNIGAIMADFAHPPALPRQVFYTSANPRFSDFGWQVTMHRRAEEFATLAQADAGGFTLSGSGSGTVTTPALFTPGATYRLGLHGSRVDDTVTAVADAHGRLTVTVPLGPANPFQEYTAASLLAGGTAVYTTQVTIEPVVR